MSNITYKIGEVNGKSLRYRNVPLRETFPKNQD